MKLDMKLNDFFVLLLLVLILCSTSKMKEAYENIYQRNDIRAEEPDDTQFYACNNEKFKIKVKAALRNLIILLYPKIKIKV